MSDADQILPGVLVPLSLLGDRTRMQGTPRGDCLHGDLVLSRGRAAGMTPPTVPARTMVLPRLAEPHVHLDKCHSIERIQTTGGDLRSAIAAQAADKAHWSEADVRARASRGLDELAAAGCAAVRSHIDWGAPWADDGPPRAWSVLRDLARDRTGMTFQLAALTGIAQLADPADAERIARQVRRDRGVLGSFVLDQPERDDGLKAAFAMADRFGLALDFHADEGLDPDLDGVEAIADIALATRHQGPVLIGHACALMNRAGPDLRRIAEKLARADIAIAALPATNLYLQSRGDGTPDRRGLTPLSELRAAGVTTTLGTDNVRDAFCPIGRHDPRQSLALAVLAAHLDPPLGAHLAMITTDARRAMGLDPVTIDGATIADLLLFDATSTPALLSDTAPPLPLAHALPGEPA